MSQGTATLIAFIIGAIPGAYVAAAVHRAASQLRWPSQAALGAAATGFFIVCAWVGTLALIAVNALGLMER